MIDLIGDILYEDNQVLVAVKPPNMLSQADRTGDPDILSVLSNMLGKCVVSRFGGSVDSEELCLPVTTGGVLPCGASGRWQRG